MGRLNLWISTTEAKRLESADVQTVIRAPSRYGLSSRLSGVIFTPPKDDGVLEMLKTAFCLVLASWMTGCLMAIVYAREIAQFIVERTP